jgi:uncharacterized membrane-anchored protein YhcB (DUF1043 family)
MKNFIKGLLLSALLGLVVGLILGSIDLISQNHNNEREIEQLHHQIDSLAHHQARGVR